MQQLLPGFGDAGSSGCVLGLQKAAACMRSSRDTSCRGCKHHVWSVSAWCQCLSAPEDLLQVVLNKHQDGRIVRLRHHSEPEISITNTNLDVKSESAGDQRETELADLSHRQSQVTWPRSHACFREATPACTLLPD